MGKPDSGNNLQIAEIFTSIQGEGRLQGELAVFVRTAGCSLRCSWCDTDYAQTGGTSMTVREILGVVGGISCPRVCVTGGEPLEQPKIQSLFDALNNAGLLVSVETNGTHDIGKFHGIDSFAVDYKLPGARPATPFHAKNWQVLRSADELKFIISDRSDYETAKSLICRHETRATIVMSPCLAHDALPGDSAKQLARWIIEDRLPVRYSLQLHKVLGLR